MNHLRVAQVYHLFEHDAHHVTRKSVVFDPNLRHLRIQGVPIQGTTADLLSTPTSRVCNYNLIDQ